MTTTQKYISPIVTLLTILGLLLSVVHFHAEHEDADGPEYVMVDHELPCTMCHMVKYHPGTPGVAPQTIPTTPFFQPETGINPDLPLFITISERAPPFRI